MMLRWAYSLYRIYLYLVRPITLGVRVMMIRGNEVLLVRQTYIGGWFMPGGGLHRGETFEGAARREVAEEVGGQLHDLNLVGVYTHFKELKSDHNILFLSTDFTFTGRHDLEIAEVRFFPLDALPEDLWAGHRLRLEEYRAHRPSPQFGEW